MAARGRDINVEKGQQNDKENTWKVLKVIFTKEQARVGALTAFIDAPEKQKCNLCQRI